MLVRLFGTLRLAVGSGRVEVSAEPTVAAVLEAVFRQHPAVRNEVVYPDRMELLPHVNIMVNGRLIRDLQGLDTNVGEGDNIAVFPPSAGG